MILQLALILSGLLTNMLYVHVSGVLNEQIFKKALFRFRTANWYLLSVLWLTINFPGKKIAAPQSQQDKVQRIPFASKQIHLRPLSQPRTFFLSLFLPAM